MPPPEVKRLSYDPFQRLFTPWCAHGCLSPFLHSTFFTVGTPFLLRLWRGNSLWSGPRKALPFDRHSLVVTYSFPSRFLFEWIASFYTGLSPSLVTTSEWLPVPAPRGREGPKGGQRWNAPRGSPPLRMHVRSSRIAEGSSPRRTSYEDSVLRRRASVGVVGDSFSSPFQEIVLR